jgi:hypothetical protein
LELYRRSPDIVASDPIVIPSGLYSLLKKRAKRQHIRKGTASRFAEKLVTCPKVREGTTLVVPVSPLFLPFRAAFTLRGICSSLGESEKADS